MRDQRRVAGIDFDPVADRLADAGLLGAGIQEGDVLGPGNADDHADIGRAEHVEEPARRHGEDAQHVAAELAHQARSRVMTSFSGSCAPWVPGPNGP